MTDSKNTQAAKANDAAGDSVEAQQPEPVAVTDELVASIAEQVAEILKGAEPEPAKPSPLGATFAERKAAREASEKRIAGAQNKAVQASESK